MGHMAGSTTQCQRSIAVPIITKGFKLSRGFAASGKRTGRISACPPLQCAALGQRLFVVLAEDCRRPHTKHHWLVINCDSCGTGFAALRKSTSDNGRSCVVQTICSL